MHSGDEVQVKLINQIDDSSAKVEIISTGKQATLKIKGRLRIRQNGIITAWVIQDNIKTGEILLGNAYFGKYSITSKAAETYLQIIHSIYTAPKEVTSENISVLKGMVNRCIRHDQWDWYTTYQYLGYPTYRIMNDFVRECLTVRDELRTQRFDALFSFREKYAFLLKSIEMHLQKHEDSDDLKEENTITALEQELWDRMSFDSKHNIKIAEQISGIASKYVLMHYLVTLEQEFSAHYIQPFVETIGKNITSYCTNRYLTTTHQILTGQAHFTLGAVYHIGKALKFDSNAKDSEAIAAYRKYLGTRLNVFLSICNIISSATICDLRITELRNGLAHGIPELVSKIDSSAFLKLQEILFGSPDFLMRKMLRNSLKY
jgi:hypothetical protein